MRLWGLLDGCVGGDAIGEVVDEAPRSASRQNCDEFEVGPDDVLVGDEAPDVGVGDDHRDDVGGHDGMHPDREEVDIGFERRSDHDVV